MSWAQAAAGLILPLVTCSLILVAAAAHLKSWRWGLLVSVLLVGVFIAAATEMLSLWQGLTAKQLTVVWLTLCTAAGVVVLRQRRSGRRTPRRPLTGSTQTRWWIAYSLGATALVAIVAVLSPTNNYDSMSYHMTRVAYWAQAHSVSFYATNNERQLYMPPWAEYAAAHLVVLSGVDWWVNLIQLSAMVISAVGASLIASQIGLDARGQAMTAALVVAIPIGIAEAATTQTDYVVTMWLVGMVAMARIDVRGPVTKWNCLAFGAFLGLALLTKPTAYFYATPVLVYFIWRQVVGHHNGRRWLLILRDAAIVAGIVIVLNVVSLTRNVGTFGSIFGSTTDTPPAASAPQTLVENSVRSIGLQLGVPSDAVNRFTTSGAVAALDLLGLSANNPKSSKSGDFVVGFSTREDNAGSLAHTVLSLLAATYLVVSRRRSHRLAVLLAAMAFGGFFLRALGQPFSLYSSRYLMTFFVFMVPVIAYFLTSLPRRLGTVTAAAVCATSLLWVVAADLRPLAGSQWLHAAGGESILTQPRQDQYFAVNPLLRAPYVQAARRVRDLGASHVGLHGGENAFEYPMWVLLKEANADLTITNTLVSTVSRQFQVNAPLDAVICLDECGTTPPGMRSYKDFDGLRVWSNQPALSDS